MEEFPKPASKDEKDPEETSEQRYLDCLDKVRKMFEEGVSDQETIDAIRGWQDREVKLDEIEKAKPEHKGISRTVDSDFEYAIRIAEVKYAAGFREDSYNDFQDTLYQAIEAKRDDIAERIRARIKELEAHSK